MHLIQVLLLHFCACCDSHSLTFIIYLFPVLVKLLRISLPGELRLAPHAPSLGWHALLLLLLLLLFLLLLLLLSLLLLLLLLLWLLLLQLCDSHAPDGSFGSLRGPRRAKLQQQRSQLLCK